MFGNRKENSENENSTKAKEVEKEVSNPNRQVKVTSKLLLDSKIIVVYKRITPANGKPRDAFNIYSFIHNSKEGRGECIMPERDAILFWKDRVEVVGSKDDVRVMTVDGEFEYDYKESKNLYKVETDTPESSEQRD